MVSKVKQHKCKACKRLYQKFSSTQKACSIECAFLLVRAAEKKKEDTQKRIESRMAAEKKKATRPLSFFQRNAQTAFNAFIRERDKSLPCISCGRLVGGYTAPQWHAGHYYTRKARPDIAFNEDNCHKQCAQCNHFMSGNIEQYRANLINKIGIDRLEKLQEVITIKPTREMYQEIEATYKRKLKELKNA